MSSANQGRQSPPPETQSGRQQQDPPASGKGTDPVDSDAKKVELQDQLKVRNSDSYPGNNSGVLKY
jgi:hypothetical protein